MSFLKAEWRKLAIANYAIDPSVLKKYVPPGTELDLWEGKCYVSLIGFMFLNTRSAGLQLLSATNFMEAGDNTWGKSLKTIFTKMPTLLKDYKMLMDTDFLLDRRNALKMDVNDSDIARIAQGKGIQGKLARFLQWGYVFTQAADSRAIALGGAVYYRNAYDSLIEQGIDPKIAKEQALLETTEHAQSSQQ